MSTFLDFSRELFSGLFMNVLFSVITCIFPLIIGIALTLICRKCRVLPKIVRIVGSLFEVLCPIVVIFMAFYLLNLPRQLATFIILIPFSFCFMGYMLIHYNEQYSAIKNIVVNGLGLFSTVFKWSFVLRCVGISEALTVAERFASGSYNLNCFWLLLFASAAILIVVEVGRAIAREFMK